MSDKRKALVLGATGGIGGAVAAAMLRHGWTLRGLTRDVAAARKASPLAIDWVEGDAMSRASVVAAAEGVELILHAVNPPYYRNWEKLVLPMIDNTIAAARAAGGARIVLPGTLYNYDPAVTSLVTATTPQTATGKKGRIRVALEQRLRDAAPEVPTLILRSGNYFGPGTRSSWFTQAMLRPGRPLRRVMRVARGPGQSWAYLPDVAEAFARVIDLGDRLQPFEVLQYGGFYDATGHEMIDALQRVAGRRLPVWSFPWWLLRLAAPFGGFPREAMEIEPFWRLPLELDNGALEALIGPEPRRPLDQALRESLIDMGCLPGPHPAPALA